MAFWNFTRWHISLFLSKVPDFDDSPIDQFLLTWLWVHSSGFTASSHLAITADSQAWSPLHDPRLTASDWQSVLVQAKIHYSMICIPKDVVGIRNNWSPEIPFVHFWSSDLSESCSKQLWRPWMLLSTQQDELPPQLRTRVTLGHSFKI